MKSLIDTVIHQPKSALSLLVGSAGTALDLEALLEAIQTMDDVILEKNNVLLEKDDALHKKTRKSLSSSKSRKNASLFWKNTCVWSVPAFTVEALKSSAVRVKSSMKRN